MYCKNVTYAIYFTVHNDNVKQAVNNNNNDARDYV